MIVKPDHQRSSDNSLPEATADRAALHFVQWVYAALAGGSFASILFVLGQGWDDPAALWALICFAVALPLFSGGILVYGEPRRMYRVTKLFGFIPMLGAVLFIAGIALLISRTHPPIAGLFVVVSLIQLVVIVNSHHRLKSHACAEAMAAK